MSKISDFIKSQGWNLGQKPLLRKLFQNSLLQILNCGLTRKSPLANLKQIMKLNFFVLSYILYCIIVESV